MFDCFLAHEGKQPARLGYDRPSAKLLAFCARHFGLTAFEPQANHFVLFDEFWGERTRGSAHNPLDPCSASRALD